MILASGQLEVNTAHYSLKMYFCGIKTPLDQDSPLHFGEKLFVRFRIINISNTLRLQGVM